MRLSTKLSPSARLSAATVLLVAIMGAPLTSANASPDSEMTTVTTESSSDQGSEVTPSPEPSPEQAPAGDTQPYLVVAKSGTTAEEVKARAVALGVDVETLLQGSIEGVAAELTAEQRAALSVEPGVDYIERGLLVSTNLDDITTSRAALIYASPPKNASGSSAATASNPATTDSLIVQYKKGVKPRSKVPITGTDRVTSVKKTDLTLGKYLGFRMYRVNFAAPVSLQVARRVADEISKSTKVELAEINSTVTIN